MSHRFCFFVCLVFIFQPVLSHGQSGWINPGDGATPTVQQYLDMDQVQLRSASHFVQNSSRGDALYRYELELPPALLKPSMELIYESTGAWGVEMGGGWSLGGIMQIERPLRRLTQTYGTNEWRLSGSDFSGILRRQSSAATRYVLWSSGAKHVVGDYDAGRDRWTVSADAVTYTLDACDAGVSPYGTTRWRVAQATDAKGNYVEYYYAPGSCRVTSVYYGGNRLTGDGHLVRLQFGYAPNLFLRTSAQRGYVESFASLLNKVAVEVNDGGVWRQARAYKIGYTDVDQVLLPTSLTREGQTAAASETIATFDYSRYASTNIPSRTSTSLPLGLGTSMSFYSDADTNDHVISSTSVGLDALGDFNGDGNMDYMDASVSPWNIHLQKVNSMTREFYWSSAGDFHPSPTGLALATSAIFVTEPYESKAHPRYQYVCRQIVDMNGDGYADIVDSGGSTVWQIQYGNGRDFLAPVHEAAPSTYSTISWAADAEKHPSWTKDVKRGLVDINGDGWLDVFDPTEGHAWLHTGVMGGGFEVAAISLGVFDALRSVEYIVGPYEITHSRHSKTNYAVYLTLETQSFVDLNGDGLVDFVDARKTPWSVKLGLGEAGFESTARVWPAPTNYISKTFEGFPTVTYTDIDTGGTKTIPGRDGCLFQAVMDVDGDGLLDLVIGHEFFGKEWYKNCGNGFWLTPKSLPGWWPDDGLVTFSSYAQNVLTYSQSISSRRTAMMDVDRDSIPDLVDVSKNIIKYGEYPRPYLLREVKNGSGGVSEVAWRSSSSTYPKGLANKFQHMSIRKDLVDRLETFDPVVNQKGETSFEYLHGFYEHGQFLGFEKQYQYSYRDTNLLSQTFLEYELNVDYEPLLVSQTIYTDRNLAFGPTLAKASVSSWGPRYKTEYRYGHAGPHYRVLQRDVYEYGESSTNSKAVSLAYRWDENGNLTNFYHNGGGVFEDACTVAIAYTSNTNQTLYRPSRKETIGFDPLSGVTRTHEVVQWLYDNNRSYSDDVTDGLLTEMRVSSGWYDAGQHVEDEALTNRYTWGTRGELIVAEDYSGMRLETTYGFGSAVPVTSKNNLGHTLQRTLDNQGRILTTRDANGVVLGAQYDDFNRVLRTTITGLDHVTHVLSDATYQTAVAPYYKRLLTYVAGHVPDATTYEVYDGLGRVSQTWRQRPDGRFAVENKTHDVFGNLLETKHPFIGSVFAPTSVLKGDVRDHVYYDAFGKSREVWRDEYNGIGASLCFFDEPWQEKRVDEEGFITRLIYDAHHRILQSEQGEVGGIEDGRLKSLASYQYDPHHRLVKYTDALNNVCAYSYDAAGRLRRVSRGVGAGPYKPWYEYAYNGQRLAKMTDSAGGYVLYEYDALGRMKKMRISDPIEPTRGASDYEWIFDTHWIGSLAETRDPSGITSYRYDNQGRLSGEFRAFGTHPVVRFSYTRDLQGRTIQAIHPSGHVHESFFNHGWLSQAQGLYAGNTNYSLHYEYNVWGLPEVMSNNFGHAWQTIHSNPLWPDRLTFTAGRMQHRRDYVWLANGLIDQRVDNATSTHIYEYNAYKELTDIRDASGATLEHYDYDDAGNLLAMQDYSGALWTYQPVMPFNQIPGRTAGLQQEQFEYDAAGRMHRLLTPTHTNQYIYDGLGRLRAVQQNGAWAAIFDRGADGQIVRRADDNPYTSSPRYEYTFRTWNYVEPSGETTEIFAPQLSSVNGSNRWHFKELDGHAAMTFDDAGSRLGYRTLGAYGDEWIRVADPSSLEAFHGNRTESHFDLTPMGPRHVRKDGLWLQPEPLLYLGIPQKNLADPRSLSTYRYAKNNPITFSDTTGFDPECDSLDTTYGVYDPSKENLNLNLCGYCDEDVSGDADPSAQCLDLSRLDGEESTASEDESEWAAAAAVMFSPQALRAVKAIVDGVIAYEASGEVQALLAEARALMAAGKTAEAMKIYEQLQSITKGRSYIPVMIETLGKQLGYSPEETKALTEYAHKLFYSTIRSPPMVTPLIYIQIPCQSEVDLNCTMRYSGGGQIQ